MKGFVERKIRSYANLGMATDLCNRIITSSVHVQHSSLDVSTHAVFLLMKSAHKVSLTASSFNIPHI